MRRLLGLLFDDHGLAARLALATVLANLLGLASSIYVMQVLNRYVTHGVSGTLLTLTIGALAAIMLEAGYRIQRQRLAASVGGPEIHRIAETAFAGLTRARLDALDRTTPGERGEAMRGVDALQAAWSPSTTTALLDAPFALVFLFVLYLVHPGIAAVVALSVAVGVGVGLLLQSRQTRSHADLSKSNAAALGLVASASLAAEPLRALRAAERMMADWYRHWRAGHQARHALYGTQGLLETVSQTTQAAMTIAVVCTGAVLVVHDGLSVGAMIAANILAARALAPILRLVRSVPAFQAAAAAEGRLDSLAGLAEDVAQRGERPTLRGGMRLDDLGHAYDGSGVHVFRDLSGEVPPGAVVAITGANGSGKTTLCKLLAGLLQPTVGRILVDGVELRQIDPAWWRGHVAYLAQEPLPLTAPLRSMFDSARVGPTDDAAMRAAIERVGLGEFLAKVDAGLDMTVTNHGLDLPFGVRRRLALAVALAPRARVAVLDEPTIGLDQTGVRKTYEILVELARAGVTLLVVSDDPRILAGASHAIDLDAARPAVRRRQAVSGPTLREAGP